MTQQADEETNTQTLEANCSGSQKEPRQPVGHPGSSAGFSAPRSPRRLCRTEPEVRTAWATGKDAQGIVWGRQCTLS